MASRLRNSVKEKGDIHPKVVPLREEKEKGEKAKTKNDDGCELVLWDRIEGAPPKEGGGNNPDAHPDIAGNGDLVMRER